MPRGLKDKLTKKTKESDESLIPSEGTLGNSIEKMNPKNNEEFQKMLAELRSIWEEEKNETLNSVIEENNRAITEMNKVAEEYNKVVEENSRAVENLNQQIAHWHSLFEFIDDDNNKPKEPENFTKEGIEDGISSDRVLFFLDVLSSKFFWAIIIMVMSSSLTTGWMINKIFG